MSLAYGDALTMGITGAVIGVAGAYDDHLVRRWEREHDARLARERRPWRERRRRPFRRRAAAGILWGTAGGPR